MGNSTAFEKAREVSIFAQVTEETNYVPWKILSAENSQWARTVKSENKVKDSYFKERNDFKIPDDVRFAFKCEVNDDIEQNFMDNILENIYVKSKHGLGGETRKISNEKKAWALYLYYCFRKWKKIILHVCQKKNKIAG